MVEQIKDRCVPPSSPWHNCLKNIASWTQHAVNASSGAGEQAHSHGHHGHHISHYGPPRGGHRGHHDEFGSEDEGRRHRGPRGPRGPPRRGSHRARWARGGHRGNTHLEFIHPAMDMVSSSDALTVTIELPGLTREDVEVSIYERALTVSGEFKPETAAPTPFPDPEGYPIGETEDEDEEDPFIDVYGNYEEKQKQKKQDGVIWKERRAGKFKRSIDLPPWVDAEKGTEASMTDGVLKIVFTKGPESKARKVTIL